MVLLPNDISWGRNFDNMADSSNYDSFHLILHGQESCNSNVHKAPMSCPVLSIGVHSRFGNFSCTSGLKHLRKLEFRSRLYVYIHLFIHHSFYYRMEVKLLAAIIFHIIIAITMGVDNLLDWIRRLTRLKKIRWKSGFLVAQPATKWGE